MVAFAVLLVVSTASFLVPVKEGTTIAGPSMVGGHISTSAGGVPTRPGQMFHVRFLASGLPNATLWGVTTYANTTYSTSPTITLMMPIGPHAFSITVSNPGYVAEPSSGVVGVGGWENVSVQFGRPAAGALPLVEVIVLIVAIGGLVALVGGIYGTRKEKTPPA